MNNVVLKAVTSQKCLCLVCDHNVSWDHQVSQVCKRMYVICCHWIVLSSNLLKLLIESLILFHLNYSLPAWGTLLHTQLLQRLKRMQNKALHLCRNIHKYNMIMRYQDLQWLILGSLMLHHSLCISLMNCSLYHYNYLFCLVDIIIMILHRIFPFFAKIPRYHLEDISVVNFT